MTGDTRATRKPDAVIASMWNFSSSSTSGRTSARRRRDPPHRHEPSRLQPEAPERPPRAAFRLHAIPSGDSLDDTARFTAPDNRSQPSACASNSRRPAAVNR